MFHGLACVLANIGNDAVAVVQALLPGELCDDRKHMAQQSAVFLGQRSGRGDVLFGDDQVVAFYDINPQAKVHFLVVPRKHISSAAALTEEDGALLGHIFTVIAKLAKEQGLENGYRIISNVGEDAGQTVKHLHFHVLGGEKLPV